MDHRKQNFTKFIQILTSVIVGGAAGLYLCFQYPPFWEVGRITRLAFALLGVFNGIILMAFIIRLLVKQLKKPPKKFNRIAVFTALLSQVFLGIIFFNGFSITVHQSWLMGFAPELEFLLKLVLALILNPLLLLLIICSVGKWLIARFSRESQADGGVQYHHFLVGVFIVLMLLPSLLSISFPDHPDDFYGTERLMQVFSLARYYLGDKLYQKSIISPGNWLVYADDNSLHDYQNTQPFSQKQLSIIDGKISAMEDSLASQGMQLIILIPPNKNTIYPEYMPEEIPVLGEESRLHQVTSYLSENSGFEIIDLETTYRNARDEAALYYMTDTHWNPNGAYLAYRAIMAEIQKSYPELKINSPDHYTVVPSPNRVGDLAHNMINVDIQESFSHWQYPPLENQETLSISQKHLQYVIQGSSAPKLIVFHDSFGNELKYFLPEHFSSTFFVQMPKIDPPLIQTFDPDIVLIVWTERFIDRLLHLPGF